VQSIESGQSLTEATPSPSTLEAWRAFLTAHAVVVRILERELIETQHLPLAEYDVLVQLDETLEGRLRMAQLADRVLLSRSGLTRLVERLETSGLVRREVCPSDARGSFAVLTKEGRTRLREAAVGHMQSIQAHFANALNCGQVEALREAMEQLVAANGGEPEDRPRGCPSLQASAEED
jgi:DNA-binding MarR family transcriptional regulator